MSKGNRCTDDGLASGGIILLAQVMYWLSFSLEASALHRGVGGTELSAEVSWAALEAQSLCLSLTDRAACSIQKYSFS